MLPGESSGVFETIYAATIVIFWKMTHAYLLGAWHMFNMQQCQILDYSGRCSCSEVPEATQNL